VSFSHLDLRDAPSTIWVIWLSLANCTSAEAGSSAVISCQRQLLLPLSEQRKRVNETLPTIGGRDPAIERGHRDP